MLSCGRGFDRAGMAIAVAGACLAGSQPALAQDSGPQTFLSQHANGSKPGDPEPWRLNAVLYGWAINVSGSITALNQTIDTNASFFDLVQRSDSLAAFMGYFEANKGAAGFDTDLVFTRLGFSAQQTNYRNPLPGLRLTLSTQEDLTYQMFIAEVGGVFELHKWPGEDEKSFTAIDAVGGFRYWNMSVDAKFDAQLNVAVPPLGFDRSFGLAIARADAIQWVDPLVGLRLRHQFTPNQHIFLRGDIGGFGLASSLTWQAVGAYSYAWQLHGGELAAVVGFRALGVDYSQTGGSFALRETMYGPIIGVSWRW